MPMKHYDDTTGNRTSDIPAYSALSQPTAPPRGAPQLPNRSFKNCCCLLTIRTLRFSTVAQKPAISVHREAVPSTALQIMPQRYNLILSPYLCFGYRSKTWKTQKCVTERFAGTPSFPSSSYFQYNTTSSHTASIFLSLFALLMCYVAAVHSP